MRDIKKRVGSGIAAVALAVGMGVVGIASPAQAASWRIEHLVVGGGVGCAAVKYTKTIELQNKGATGIKWTNCYTASNGDYMRTVEYYL